MIGDSYSGSGRFSGKRISDSTSCIGNCIVSGLLVVE